MGTVRYHFQGSRRHTGESVEGRVSAPSEEAALDVLRHGGIVAGTLTAEPAAGGEAPGASGEPLLARAVERALDDAGFRVSFDLESGRYQGKTLRLLDQERLRRRVEALIDGAADRGPRDGEEGLDARRHIAPLLEQLLQYRRDLGTGQSPRSQALEARVNHIAQALVRIEQTMSSMSLALRRSGRGGAQRVGSNRAERGRTHDEVLNEIFRSNLALLRGLEEATSREGGHAA
jgi:hypothetical protein